MIKKRFLIFAIFVSFVAGILFTHLTHFNLSGKQMTKIHTLKSPLLLTSENEGKVPSMLPAGTTMYFDRSFPEGFTRYKIYVNIDRYPLELTDLDDPTLIIPLEARPLDKPDPQRLLKEYPLTKADVEAILRSNRLSKEEIRKILEDYISR